MSEDTRTAEEKAEDNGQTQAFPVDHDAQVGMTLREYYAGKALQGLCGNASLWSSSQPHLDVAAEAVAFADLLLIALAKIPHD